ncbi:CPBP family intramembrane glutamic endopeptidase [Occallatibacter riparius]|uniref:CPBP family intramembrane metalloprotease n=1 Tax=Occallatibacter riparius TaxID=1002689 RepID=A0A9J7BW25_9BACT|nr:CPBP family intramembrane glutamic endopeptidase [Occallatibacter riparius]UWZ86002.1 CPBP family intramembrane metalloprotease [Occallatibacter riparius]
MLIFTTSFVKTTSLMNTIKVGAITCLLTYGLTLLFLRSDRWSLRDAGLELVAKSVPRMLFGFGIGFALVALQESLLYAGGHIHWTYARPSSPMSWLLLGISAYFLLALREEIAFRAYPLRRLEVDFGMWPSVLIVGLIFAFEHLAGGLSWSLSLLGPFAGAILFGMAALATRGIAVPLGIHFAFNLGQWVMGQKEVTGFWQASIDPTFQKQAEVLGYTAYFLGTSLAAYCFWVQYRRRSKSFVAHDEAVGVQQSASNSELNS